MLRWVAAALPGRDCREVRIRPSAARFIVLPRFRLPFGPIPRRVLNQARWMSIE